MIAGWTRVSLGDVCTVTAGGTPSRANPDYWAGDIPWVKISDMLQGVITHTDENVSRLGLTNSAAKVLPKGTLLLSIFATVGRTAVLNLEATTNQAIVGLGIKDPLRLERDYLRRFLEFKTTDLQERARGVAQVNINGAILKSLQIPLPPLSEQRRIAAVLDGAETLRTKRRAALAKLDTLTQAIFLDMFGDPVSNPSGWPELLTLGDVAEIVSGVTKGRSLADKITRPVPYLAVANVQDRWLDLSAVKTIPATEDEIRRYHLLPNDLLLTEGGDPDKLGRGALWNGQISDCIHQNHIFRVRLKVNTLTPLFLNWLVGSSRGKRYFLRSAKQTTGIASINMTQLRGFPLLVPPIGLQEEFSRRVGAVEGLKTQSRNSLAQIEALLSSLQHRAFRGEL